MFDVDVADIDPALAAVVRSLQIHAATDVAGEDEQRLCDTVQALEVARRYLDAAEGHVLAELDARGVTDRSFGLRTPQWLAHVANLPSHVAKARVHTATKLRRALPDAERALAEGRIGFDHARVLADAANPRIEEPFAAAARDFCDAASEFVFEKWAKEVRGFADRLDQDGGHDPDDDLARNRLRFSRLGANAVLNGELVGEHALISDHVLNTVADELFRQFSADHDQCPELAVPDRATLMALAFVEICRRAQGVDTNSSTAPRTEAALVIPADDLDRVTDHHGTDLPEFAHRCLACDPQLHALVVNSLGVPVDMGRDIRFANRAQRRAMAQRDGGCVFPGCGSPPTWCDAHHQRRWSDGGRTNLDELISLCRHHHGVAHRTGWNVELTNDGWTRWSTPLGNTFWGQRHQRQRAGPLPHAA